LTELVASDIFPSNVILVMSVAMSRSGFSDRPQAAFGMPPRARISPSTPAEAEQELSATVRLGPGGRVVIPADMRESMGLAQGDEMVAHLENGRLTLVTANETVRQLQEAMALLVPEGVSLAGDLIADRRREAALDAD
jgi:AbrB family looped-hinge helix DNA binding protein